MNIYILSNVCRGIFMKIMTKRSEEWIILIFLFLILFSWGHGKRSKLFEEELLLILLLLCLF